MLIKYMIYDIGKECGESTTCYTKIMFNINIEKLVNDSINGRPWKIDTVCI